MAGMKFAKQSVKLRTPDGLGYDVRENEPWDADDPLVRANPDFFANAPIRIGHTVPNAEDLAQREALGGPAAPRIEQATRAPGEVRRGR